MSPDSSPKYSSADLNRVQKALNNHNLDQVQTENISLNFDLIIYFKNTIWDATESNYGSKLWQQRLRKIESSTTETIVSNEFFEEYRDGIPAPKERNSSQCYKDLYDTVTSLYKKKILPDKAFLSRIALDDTARLAGIRSGNIFYVLWLDKHHQVFPTIHLTCGTVKDCMDCGIPYREPSVLRKSKR